MESLKEKKTSQPANDCEVEEEEESSE